MKSLLILSLIALVPIAPARAALRRRSEPLFRITLLGTGNPRPSPQRAGPAILVEAGDQRILIDAGREAATRLFQIGRANLLAGTSVLLLTHLHSDHVVGLPDLWLTGWLFGRDRPLAIYGPRGTTAMTSGMEQAFEFDVRMRRDIDEKLPASGAQLKPTEVVPGIVFERGGVKVAAFAVDHGPVQPAYGYRIDFAGRSAAFSGDTRPSEALVESARGVDVLVHEVVSPEVERSLAQVKDPARIERIIARHTTPEQAGRIFTRIQPRLAVYTHIVPSPASARDLIPPTKKTYGGRVIAGYDLMSITIGERIKVSKRKIQSDR